MVRGPKPAIQPELLKQKLVEFELLESNYQLKNRSNCVWKDICISLEEKIKPLNLFLMVKSNRYEVLNYYFEQKNLTEVYSQNNGNKNTEDCEKQAEGTRDQDYESQDVFKENDKDEDFTEVNINWEQIDQKTKLEFEIDCDWHVMKPIDKCYKNQRQVKVLPPGWGDIIGKAAYQLHKLPCAFNFKRHLVNMDECSISFERLCTDCGNNLFAKCSTIPNDDATKITFKVIIQSNNK